ncbi:hypothetical protein EAI_11348 [Harpegnathos saltator]|uniref:Uncharacterized protein n=1 Tax=Harpegnathos saltator TaxID=610380 RepID=E2C032_HARSA|nr:hypothetical protein EAI_11348 [Harpegnathos saltator]
MKAISDGTIALPSELNVFCKLTTNNAAGEAFCEITISPVLERVAQGRPNGVNVPHQHPRFTCVGM